MTSRPTVISIMSSIVYCGAKLGNLLTGVDLSNLGIFNRFQHVFGFRDQNSQQNQVNVPRLFSMNNNEPTPITRFQGLQNQYSDIHQFNSSLEETFNSLNQLPINVLIDTVASSIVVSNNGVLSFRPPSLGIYRSVVCLASWMLTGISPITTNVAISLLEPSISNVLNRSILKIASLIEPYRNMWLCQAATSIFDKIAQITLRIIPQSFINLFNSNSQQNAEQPILDENNQFSQNLPIQISSHQHAQYYINMFDQEINQLHQMVDLLLKIQIQSSLSLQTQRRPNPDFYHSSFAETLRNGTVQEKIKLIVDAFSKFLSLLLQIQTSANKFNLDFPHLENQVFRNQNSIQQLDSKFIEQKRQAGIIEQKINQINQRIDIINQFPPTQSPDLDQLTKLLQDFIQSQINQLASQLDQTINQMKINYDNQFNDLNQEQLKHQQSLIDLHIQLQQLKEQITDQINQININHINQFIIKTISQSMSLVEGQMNNVWASINELNFFISTKYSENDLLIKSCIEQYNQLKQDLQQNVYSKDDVDKITQGLYQQILSQIYQSMPEYLAQQYQLNPQDISYIKQQLNNLPQPQQITDQAFNELKTHFENFRDYITTECTNSSRQIQTLQQENANINQQLTLQLANIDQQQQTTEELQHHLNQQQNTNTMLQQQIDQLTQNQEQQLQRCDNLDQRLDSIMQRVDEYQTRQQSLTDRIDQLNQEILSVRTQQQKDVQGIQTLIQTLSQTITTKVDIAQFEQAFQNLVSKNYFDNYARQQENEIRQLQAIDQQIISDINQINTLLLQVQNYIAQISNQVITKDIFNEFQQQVEREITDIQGHIQEIHDIPQQLNHVQLQVEQLENQLNTIFHDYGPLQIYNLKSQLQSLKEISYKKFDQLDYVANITQVNRILDFNHSAAIKSY